MTLSGSGGEVVVASCRGMPAICRIQRKDRVTGNCESGEMSTKDTMSSEKGKLVSS